MLKSLPAVQETQVWSLGQEDSLEEGIATHTSILAWRIPWREEPDGLQSVAWQRVRLFDWLTLSLSFPSVSIYSAYLDDGLVSWACLEGLEQHRFIPSGFWRTEGQNQGISRGHTFSQGSRESLPCLCQHLWWLSLWWPTSHITCVTSLWHTQLAHTALQFLAPSSPCLFPFNVWVQTLNVSFLFL